MEDKVTIFIVAIVLIGFYFYNGGYFEGVSFPITNNSDINIDMQRDYGVIEEEIYRLVNEERSKKGRSPLRQTDYLNNLARGWSEKMIDEGFFEHSNYNVGENIAEVPIHYWVEGCGMTFTNKAIAECFVKSWIESSGHYRNMVDYSYYSTGVGVSCDAITCRATQVFK